MEILFICLKKDAWSDGVIYVNIIYLPKKKMHGVMETYVESWIQ